MMKKRSKLFLVALSVMAVTLSGYAASPESPFVGLWGNQIENPERREDPDYLRIKIEARKNDFTGVMMDIAQKDLFDEHYEIKSEDKVFTIALQEYDEEQDWEKGVMIQMGECLYPYYPYGREWRMIYFLLCSQPDKDQLMMRYSGEDVMLLERKQ